jgi:hypothetical protein
MNWKRAWSSAVRSTSRDVRCGVARPVLLRSAGPSGMPLTPGRFFESLTTSAAKIEASSLDQSRTLPIG